MKKIEFFLMKLFISLKHAFNLIEPEIETGIIETFKILNVVKTWDKEHTALEDFIVGLIPTNIDNIILDKIRQILKNIPANFTVLTGDERKLFLHNLSLQVALAFTGGKVTFASLVHLVQWYFDNHNTSAPSGNLVAEVATVEQPAGLTDYEALHKAALLKIS